MPPIPHTVAPTIGRINKLNNTSYNDYYSRLKKDYEQIEDINMMFYDF